MNGFVGGLMMAVGLVMALTCGLCSVVFTGVVLQAKIAAGGDKDAFDIAIGFIVAGFAAAAIGIWLFRRGRARLRRGS